MHTNHCIIIMHHSLSPLIMTLNHHRVYYPPFKWANSTDCVSVQIQKTKQGNLRAHSYSNSTVHCNLQCWNRIASTSSICKLPLGFNFKLTQTQQCVEGSLKQSRTARVKYAQNYVGSTEHMSIQNRKSFTILL